MKIAQSRQISYADSKWREVTYEVGDRAYLRVSLLRGVKRFRIKGKLAPRFIGPYKVSFRKGEVAYELELPEVLSAVHDVFHVSQLKKCHPEKAETTLRYTLPLEEVQLDSMHSICLCILFVKIYQKSKTYLIIPKVGAK